MHFAVGMFRAVDGDALPFMTARAAELSRRMGVVAEEDFPFRMGFERIGLLFKPRSIYRQVAGLTPIHARDGLIETVAVELFERHLLDIRNLIEGERPELERDVLHDSDPFVSFRSELPQLDFDFLDAITNRFYFVLDQLAFLARLIQFGVEPLFFFIELFNALQVGLDVALLLHRMIVLVPSFLQLTLDVLDVLVDVLKANRGRGFLFFQRRELLAQRTAAQTRLRGGQLLGKFLVGGIGLQFLVFFVIGGLGLAVVETVETSLQSFSQPARNVVVPEGPARQYHQEGNPDEENAPVGFLFFVFIDSSFRHPRYLTRPCAQARGPRKKPRDR